MPPQVLPNFQFKTNVAKLDIIGDKPMACKDMPQKALNVADVAHVGSRAKATIAIWKPKFHQSEGPARALLQAYSRARRWRRLLRGIAACKSKLQIDMEVEKGPLQDYCPM